MKAILSSGTLNRFPNTIIALGEAKGVKVFGPNDKTNKILTNVYPSIRTKYCLENLKSHFNSQAYINLCKKIGISPDSAFLPYLQIKRVLKGSSIGNINNVVNQYMALELLYNLSLAAYDFDYYIWRNNYKFIKRRGNVKIYWWAGTFLEFWRLNYFR